MSEVRRWEEHKAFDHEGEDRWRRAPDRRQGGAGEGVSTGWLLAGAALLALGALAVYHFGPDFRRYIKMERM